MSSVTGLSAGHRAEARRHVALGARLLLKNAAKVHYTQDADARWEGIREHKRASSGQFPTHGDCSSTHAWLLWDALTRLGVTLDTVNGLAWRSGYTGTIATHGKPVVHLANAQVGDSVLYGRAWPYEHVATYMGGGLVFSHGSEKGPFLLPIDYRSDRAMIRRHI